MISTGEIVVILFLFILISLAIWWLVIAYRYGQSVGNFSYTRGANIDTAATPDKNGVITGKGTVNMTCDPDRVICLVRANVICSGSSLSNDEIGFEPISGGGSGNNAYGDFDKTNTVDITETLAATVNGLQSYTYNFDGTQYTFGPKNQQCTIPSNPPPTPTTYYGQRPQLVATYTCMSPNTQCQTVKPKLQVREPIVNARKQQMFNQEPPLPIADRILRNRYHQ